MAILGLIQEYRVERFKPPYMSIAKPTYTMTNKDWTYNQLITVVVTTQHGGAVTFSMIGAESSTHGNSKLIVVFIIDVSC